MPLHALDATTGQWHSAEAAELSSAVQTAWVAGDWLIDTRAPTPEYSTWTPTRAEGAIMPSAVNGAAVAWDALGRMESHDGLTIDDWSFDHRAL